MIIDAYLMQYGLLLANALLLAAAAIALTRARAELRRMTAFQSSPAAAAMQAEPYDDRDLRRMFDRRCTMLEARLQQLVERHATTAASGPVLPPQKNELPVDYAVRMARSGAGLDDLVRGCGLNRGEAQLLLRLHASRRTTADPAAH